MYLLFALFLIKYIDWKRKIFFQKVVQQDKVIPLELAERKKKGNMIKEGKF